MKFLVTVDRDRAGEWVMTCPAIPGCALKAPTRQEADAGIMRAIKSLLEIRAGRKLALTVELLKYHIIGDRRADDIVWTGEAARIAELIRTGVEPGAVKPPEPVKERLGSKSGVPAMPGMGWRNAGANRNLSAGG
jgi:predicted RNase H-like HicB family nuclease